MDEALIERLVRIETKLDLGNSQYADHELRIRDLERDNVTGGHADHELRIRRVEKSLWLLAGASAAGGGLVGSMVAPVLQRLAGG